MIEFNKNNIHCIIGWNIEFKEKIINEIKDKQIFKIEDVFDFESIESELKREIMLSELYSTSLRRTMNHGNKGKNPFFLVVLRSGVDKMYSQIQLDALKSKIIEKFIGNSTKFPLIHCSANDEECYSILQTLKKYPSSLYNSKAYPIIFNEYIQRINKIDKQNQIDVSCIILSNLNDLFVKERTIPSIIENSKSHNIEIIVVDNGPKQNFECDYSDVKVIRSDVWHIPKAYNNGVSKAKGKYIALFHDDCEIYKDDMWIDKLTNELNDVVWLVGPEEHPNLYGPGIIKEVPFMMERLNFKNLGGYDETYYVGWQAEQLQESIFYKDKRIKKVDIGYNHFDGMSTILFGHDDDIIDALKRLFIVIRKKSTFDMLQYKFKLWRGNVFASYFNISLEDDQRGWKWYYSKMPTTREGIEGLRKALNKYSRAIR